jgi:hypothetical protein
VWLDLCATVTSVTIEYETAGLPKERTNSTHKNPPKRIFPIIPTKIKEKCSPIGYISFVLWCCPRCEPVVVLLVRPVIENGNFLYHFFLPRCVD